MKDKFTCKYSFNILIKFAKKSLEFFRIFIAGNKNYLISLY